MINVLKNDFCRIRPRLGSVITMLAITLVSMFFAVYVTGIQQVKGHVALVTSTSASGLSTKYLSVEVMKEKPPRSALVKQQYDAFIVDKGRGQYEIDTLRSNEFKNMLQLLLKNPNAKIPAQKTDRGVGVNVVGFLMIFLSMSAFFYFYPFAEDKEQGQLLRISASPVSFRRYLAAHFLFCLSSYVPAWLVLAVMQAVGWNIGFTLAQYAGLFLLLASLSIMFALLLHTFIKKPDNANMFGNSILIVTTTLGGCFYSFSKNNAVLDNIIKILPQKQFMELALDVQNGDVANHLFPLVYILILSLLMFGVSYAKLKHDYVERA